MQALGFKFLSTFLLLLIQVTSCKKDQVEIRSINDHTVPDNLKINEIQILGSHNSYRLNTDKDIYETLLTLQSLLPPSLDLQDSIMSIFH